MYQYYTWVKWPPLLPYCRIDFSKRQDVQSGRQNYLFAKVQWSNRRIPFSIWIYMFCFIAERFRMVKNVMITI